LGAEKKAMKEEEEEEKEKQQQGPKSQSVPSGHLAGANVFEKPAETVSPVAQTDLRLKQIEFLAEFFLRIRFRRSALISASADSADLAF
jgi:hypothetical protein